ncbi:NUDIX domain-containing protein [Actinomyces oricola]|uniref:NUDIX domain-containing protein n=1 Tax=Actinomyces oricola TaxID=206043 RepID=UPI000FFE62A1|nr:NUDIX domain-containing protein [Actinomyces oricola]
MSTPSPTPRLVVAAAVLDSLSHPTAMLCAARSYPPEHAGLYELPGGKVDPGETPPVALRRELREEISLEVRLGAELPPPARLAVAPPAPGQRRGPGDDAPAWPVLNGYRMRVWLAEPAVPGHGPRRGGDHEDMRWVGLEGLGELGWLSADEPIVRALRALLTSVF